MVKVYIHHGITKYVKREQLKQWGYAGIIVDNAYLEYGYPRLDILINRIRRYKPEAAIGPDSKFRLCKALKSTFKDIAIIYPIHYEKDLRNIDINAVDYIGYPTLGKVRHFSLQWYLKHVPKEKRFMLGFTKRDVDILITYFDAGDTVYPQFCADYGKDIYGVRRFKSFKDGIRVNAKEFIMYIRKREKQARITSFVSKLR